MAHACMLLSSCLSFLRSGMRISASENAAEEFALAYEEYRDAIFRHCYFQCFDREQALDLTQEAFIKT